ncbi:hypothetical protein AN478_07055 [Thiohalorhabdus denitrificans]|uniref:DEAD/DEAH box helicase domain-containing protein n=1 Tax=Thiohalorhabdus denitrificans TaxID=381306 RepID=A0A0P9C528_9GAMM|nr:DEAD/DEAH box helicase [Thiohalorhabdus denitrificans]KPV39946.1 hypothetical protein AN478_07055 [Thiohalorhabdus denitrificans]SCY09422.1 DEAD/DEAH box helicase domain-containing protein [Thiohalorhabdus denitrificans]
MNAAKRFYGNAVNRLAKGSSQAVLGLRGFRSEPLRDHLRAEFQQAPGHGNALLADPVFEAAYGWEPSGRTMADLRGNLLHGEAIKALANPVQKDLTEDFSFPEARQPFTHQLQAWQALRDTENGRRSVLVTSGTGSGKTECFLVPILDDLTRELAENQNGGQEGVRAVFLYPLNALIKSQKERLQAWSEPFEGKIRFCLYNGDTPDQAKSPWQCEVPDRRTLRDSPPQILVTNPTMLEYMLVRAEDQPIVAKSQGRLRWIVIDEAHTYLGSQAAELTLLLRRTMHAFGCAPGDVHIVATSATLGNDDEASWRELEQFLADLAGVDTTQVTVIAGKRETPETLRARPDAGDTPPSPSSLETEDARSLYQTVCQEPALVRLRDSLVERPRTLTQLTHVLFGEQGATNQQATLELLDACSRARNEQGRPFLPLRGHLFHRTLPGLWVCADAHCSEKAGTPLEKEDWPFGAVYLERREHCRCGMPAFELVQCMGCGAEYLLAQERAGRGDGEYYLRPVEDQNPEDEFQQDLEPLESETENQSETPEWEAGRGLLRLITPEDHATQIQVGLGQDGQLDWSGNQSRIVNLRAPDDNGLSCGNCGDHQGTGPAERQFRPVRVGAPFLLTSTTPTLLSLLPESGETNTAQPLEGRRLVTFTDSRQGTARSVIKAQQQIERDYVGSLIYHSLAASRETQPDTETITKTKDQIAALEQAVGSNPNLKQLLDEQRARLEQLKTPSAPELGWEEMAGKLISAQDFSTWMSQDLRELSFRNLSERDVADLCLYREFFLRPKRQYSLEGLGFAQLRYPALESTTVPAVLQQKQVPHAEWVNLLRLALDTFVRSGAPSVEIPANVRRWLGYPGKPSLLIAPDSGDRKTHPDQRYWPSSGSRNARRNRLIRLLSHAFGLDLDEESHARFLDEVLTAMWKALTGTGVLSPTEGGFQLNLKKAARIRGVETAWLCPVTRRLLPVTFMGFTPYLPDLPAPDSLAECREVPMPQLPFPFWQGADQTDPESWLESDASVTHLRVLGGWTDLSDRIARFSRYYRAAEHSAQLSGAELTRREREFKEGRINLLSCSTTMEMGVDIGGLSAVAMNNVPPHPANFLQRAGRAGRRGESAALSFTLCKATPHGEAVFRNPLWPFNAELATPRVDLRSIPIVQRHINALALATFLSANGPDSVPRLRTGWFYEASGEEDQRSTPAERFIYWCRAPESWPTDLPRGLKSLTRGSQLEGITVQELMDRTAEAMQAVSSEWLNEIRGLLAQYRELATKDGQSKPEIALNMRLDRWRREYLLRQLANQAFLPGYGFPTGVVPLVTTTAEELNRDRASNPQGEREDNRQRRAGYPTRDLAVAMRDYAPGTDTVLNGRVYRSSGVTLNWQLPVEAEGAPEIQDLRWIWQCAVCGANGVKLARPDTCPACGSEAAKLQTDRFLQPAGFAVDFRSTPHNDVSVPQYIPVREPLIAMHGAEWMMLPNAPLGRFRTTPSGTLFHRSDGINANGYALCLRCGRADSMTVDGDRPSSLDGHKRLQGGKLNDQERVCPGNEESWAILDKVLLGATYATEIFELQLQDAFGNPVKDRAAAYTLGVALRRAFCNRVGIEEGELGATAAASRDQHENRTQSLYLYDTASGGAGYASQVPGVLPELLRTVKSEVLSCPNDCDSACQACLLTYETQFQVDHLNRHKASEVLTEEFLAALQLPEELRLFGERSHLEIEPLALAVEREWQRRPFTQIRLFLGGSANEWEPLHWRFLDTLRRLKTADVEVTLVLDRGCLEELEQSQLDELFAIAAETDAYLYSLPAEPPISGDSRLPLAVEIADSNHVKRWATSDPKALVPAPFWGSGDTGARFIQSPWQGDTLTELKTANAIQPEALRPQPSPGVTELEITHQLDGSLEGFGRRAWTLITEQVPDLASLLWGEAELSYVAYSDRYLRSPIQVVLMERLIAGLKDYPGGLGAGTEIHVLTTKLGKPHFQEPRAWSHDWQDRQDRDDVARAVLTDNPGTVWWEVKDLHSVPHARILILEWTDGTKWEIRLDQGVGYWREDSAQVGSFPFMASISRQVTILGEANFQVRPQHAHHPTFWYALKK